MKKIQLALLPLLIQQSLWAQEKEVVLDEIHVASTNPFASLTNNKVSGQAQVKTLGQRSTFDLPLNVTGYSEKIVEDQQARNITDLLGRNDPSVTAVGGEAYALHGVSVRGFRIDSREFSMNGLPGMAGGYQSSMAYVGNVDLMKGPVGALGAPSPESAVGGAVNVQSKKAGPEDLTRVGVGYFSDSRGQGTVDLSRRFGNNKEWGLRFNGLYRNGESSRRHLKEENSTVALNADYDQDNLRGQIDLIRNNRNNEAGRARFDSLNNYKFQLPAAPTGRTNLAQPWSWQDSQETITTATGEIDLNGDTTLYGGIGHNDAAMKQLFSQMVMDNDRGDFHESNGGYWDFQMKTTSANLGLKGRRQLGSISHDWAISADYMDRKRGNANNTVSKEDANFPAIMAANNIYNVKYFPAPSNLSYSFKNRRTNNYRNGSIGLVDTIGFFDDRWRLTLAGRMQRLEQKTIDGSSGQVSNRYKKNAFNPLVALAYQPREDFIVYGNYAQDLEPGDVVDDEKALNNGEALAPYKTRAAEIGLRKNWGDITATAAVFQSSQPTAYLDKSSNRYGLYGKSRYRGLEVNGYGSFLDNRLRPGLGFTLMDGKLLHQANGDGAVVGMPRFIAKGNVEWDIPHSDSWTVKGGFQHFGPSYQDPAEKYRLKGYTLFDAGLKYQQKLGGRNFTVGLSAENIFDRKYWQASNSRAGTRSYAIQGLGRTVWLTGSIDL